METKTNMGALTRLLLGINIFIAMSSGGALGAAALLWVNPGVRALLPPAAATAAPLLLSALAAVALAPALLLVVARHTPTVLYSVSYSVWCRCLAAALVWVNPGVRALLPPAAAAAAPLLLSALAAVALAPALLLVVARHTPTVLYSVSYSVWCRCLAAALVWVNPGVRALLPPAAAAAAPLLLSALAAVALAPALLLVVARHTPTVLYSVSYSVWCRCLAAALVWVNPGVRALLPPAAAAAAPLLLSALAAVALAPALLLVVARHTSSVLYSYAALSLCVACGAAGAGGWLALVLARAVLDNTPRMAVSGARVLANTITGGLIGPGQTATTYVAYSLNIIVGATWAALTGLAQVAAAVVAAVAARRAARKLDVIKSI